MPSIDTPVAPSVQASLRPPVLPAARPPAADEHLAVPQEVLSFRLGAEEYGLDILRVQEIRSYEACTRIAGAPDFLRGVVNLRGVIVPVLDLRLKFGLAEAPLDGSTVTIVLSVAQRVVGVVVDSVSDVLQLGAHEVLPPPAFSGSVDASHITGIATVMQGDTPRMLVLVDIEQLLSSADLGLVCARGH